MPRQDRLCPDRTCCVPRAAARVAGPTPRTGGAPGPRRGPARPPRPLSPPLAAGPLPCSAGEMRRRPALLALGLVLAALGAAHGQHRADYDREALLGGQVGGRGRERPERRLPPLGPRDGRCAPPGRAGLRRAG